MAHVVFLGAVLGFTARLRFESGLNLLDASFPLLPRKGQRL